jgi:hypothetical protein
MPGRLASGGDSHGSLRVVDGIGENPNDIIQHTEESRPNIAFVVRHLECITDKAVEGKPFTTDRASNLEEWVGWVLHVGTKPWMDTNDLLRMIEFWWTHKGERQTMAL